MWIDSFCRDHRWGRAFAKTGIGWNFLPVVAVLCLLLPPIEDLHGSVVTIKFPADLDLTTQFTTSSGGSLSGNLVRVGAFSVEPPDLMDAAFLALTNPTEILAKLDSKFLPFGSFSFSESFLTPQEEYFQLPVDPSADIQSLNQKNIFLLFYNATSTQLGILQSKNATFNFSGITEVPTELLLQVDEINLLLGHYDQLADRWETADLEGGVGRILAPTNETVEAGDLAILYIKANHGADRFAVTNLQVSTNGGGTFSNTTNTWITVSTNTGRLTLAVPENDTNRYRITLIASNTLTGVSASNGLQLNLMQPTGPNFGTSNNLLRVTAGVSFTTNLTATRAATFTNVGSLPDWLSFSNQGTNTLVLSGTPPLIATSLVRFRAIDSTNNSQTRSRLLTLVADAPVLELPGVAENGLVDITVGTGSNTLIPVSSPGFRIDQVTITEGGSAFGAGTLVITNSTNLVLFSTLQPTAKTNTLGTRIILQAVQSNSNGIISAAREFRLRLAAPPPTRLIGTNVFEVDVGRPFSTKIQTDVGDLADMSFSNLPSGLGGFADGTISGTNRSTTLPYEFNVRVQADSSVRYWGGGVFTSTVTLRLRNPDPPVFASATNRLLVAKGRSVSVDLVVSNLPFLFASSNLPSGLSISGTKIVGTPAVGGIFPSDLTAYNSLRPGLTNNPDDWQPGFTKLIFHVADAIPNASLIPTAPGILPRNSAISTNDNLFLLPGGAENAGVRISAYGLPPGLSLDPATGKLYGTTGGSGSYTATVFIKNGRGWVKKSVTLTVQ